MLVAKARLQPAGQWLIGQQRVDARPRQVQVVPTPLGLELFRLQVQPVQIQKGPVPRRQPALVGRRRRHGRAEARRLHGL